MQGLPANLLSPRKPSLLLPATISPTIIYPYYFKGKGERLPVLGWKLGQSLPGTFEPGPGGYLKFSLGGQVCMQTHNHYKNPLLLGSRTYMVKCPNNNYSLPPAGGGRVVDPLSISGANISESPT